VWCICIYWIRWCESARISVNYEKIVVRVGLRCCFWRWHGYYYVS